MPQDVGFNKDELKIFSFLADGEGHALWEMQSALKMDKGYLSKILNKLNTLNFIYKQERILIRPDRRGPKKEYPWYIKDEKLPDITKTVLSQIKHYMSKSMAAANGLEILKVEGNLTCASKDELVAELLCYADEANHLIDFFKIALFRDHAAKLYHIDCITHEGLQDLIHSEFGLQKYTIESRADEEKYKEELKNATPKHFFEKASANLRQAIQTESERKKLEANADTVLKIKELWNNGHQNWKFIAEAINQPSDVVIAQISKMLDCNEITLTESKITK